MLFVVLQVKLGILEKIFRVTLLETGYKQVTNIARLAVLDSTVHGVTFLLDKKLCLTM